MARQSSFVSAQNDILLFRCAGRSALCFLLPFIKALHDLIIGLHADGRQFSAQFHTGSLEALLHCSAEGIDLGGSPPERAFAISMIRPATASTEYSPPSAMDSAA